MEHDQLVHLLYDCAAGEKPFSDALAQLAARVRAPYAHVLVVEGPGRLAETHFHGHDGSAFASYETHWRDRDPRFALGNAHVGRLLSDVDHLDSSAFERSEIFNDFLRPQGVRYTLFGQLGLKEGRVAAHAFMRSRTAGPFETSQRREMERLLPHVGRALELRRLVRSCGEELADLRAALDRVPSPLVIVDDKGRVSCASASAERLLAAGDGLRIMQQRLAAASPATSQRLASALARVAALADAPSRASAPAAPPEVVQVPRAHGSPLGLVFLPLRPRCTLRDGGDSRARVLVVVEDPDARVRLDPLVLARLHALTPTEALLATALAQGQSLADYAAARGCSEQTARTHLKRVLEKTRTRRQAELVRVLLGSAALQLVAVG